MADNLIKATVEVDRLYAEWRMNAGMAIHDEASPNDVALRKGYVTGVVHGYYVAVGHFKEHVAGLHVVIE